MFSDQLELRYMPLATVKGNGCILLHKGLMDRRYAVLTKYRNNPGLQPIL